MFTVESYSVVRNDVEWLAAVYQHEIVTINYELNGDKKLIIYRRMPNRRYAEKTERFEKELVDLLTKKGVIFERS